MKENPRCYARAFPTGNEINEMARIIIQAADGEVKPLPPIEVYKSDLHGYWMVRWCGHEYATECPAWWGPHDVVTYLEHETGEKVEVKE